MSEYQLTIVGTICGAIGAFADITIVVLMIREKTQPVSTSSQQRRRYWPWIVALVLTTVASVAPAYFIYRLTGHFVESVDTGASQAIPTRNAPSTTQPPVGDWNRPPDATGGPIGPILAVELASTFEQLPKPCTVKTTAPPQTELASTITWILTYGSPSGDLICTVESANPGPPNVDEPAPPAPTIEPGIVIHWNQNYKPGERIAHFFDADGFKVRVSHRLPTNSPPGMIWLDIGPGSPWK
jgi:hypothetical protein